MLFEKNVIYIVKILLKTIEWFLADEEMTMKLLPLLAVAFLMFVSSCHASKNYIPNHAWIKRYMDAIEVGLVPMGEVVDFLTTVQVGFEYHRIEVPELSRLLGGAERLLLKYGVKIDPEIKSRIYWEASNRKNMIHTNEHPTAFFYDFYEDALIQGVCDQNKRIMFFGPQALGFIQAIAGVMLMHVNDTESAKIGLELFQKGRGALMSASSR